MMPQERHGAIQMDPLNLFHEALTKVRDIAKNGTRNAAAWQEVLEVVDRALDAARKIDRKAAIPTADREGL